MHGTVGNKRINFIKLERLNFLAKFINYFFCPVAMLVSLSFMRPAHQATVRWIRGEGGQTRNANSRRKEYVTERGLIA